ncbi:MAG: ABC transporter permease [Methylococcales bacterium]|nr:ABC transporter permease [Methylococcales bacterium]
MKATIRQLGQSGCNIVEQSGLLGIFLGHCLVAMFTPPVKFQRIIRQLHFIGARSTSVVLFAGTFTGMVVALQFHDTLIRFGSVDLLGSAVALSLIRELGPVMTALMVTGRVGSAICAEIGIMRVSEQIDGLECIGIDPYRFLVMPKLWAGILSLPLLTGLFNIAGIIGGYLVGVVLLEVGQGTYIHGLYSGIEWNDVAMSLIKSFAFGWIIIWVCAAKGFFLHRQPKPVFGAEGVSQVTTNAVVFSSISILFADYVIGALML